MTEGHKKGGRVQLFCQQGEGLSACGGQSLDIDHIPPGQVVYLRTKQWDTPFPSLHDL